MTKLFAKPLFDSKIKSANTEGKEKVWGYFVGPMFMCMAYYGIAGTYLTQFYTDVLGLSGVVLTMMPVFSKIFDAITNIIMGRIIDKTKTRQGKARPWILISGVLIMLTGIMLYNVPRASQSVQLVWIVISYNLFFAFAYTIYNMSHTLMVPLATRNTRQRDSLAMLTSTGTSMIPGMLVTIIMPILVAKMGVGLSAQGNWAKVMSIISIFALPAVLVEYYFTKERVTEENISDDGENTMQIAAMKDQIKACVTNKYFWMVMAFWAIFQLTQNLQTNVMLYFCNWVLGSSVTQGATNQILVNAVGQAPLGFGIFILWPLIHKFGKRWVTQIGFVIAAVGCLIIFLNPHSLGTVLGGCVLKSFGMLPTYAMAAFLEKGYFERHIRRLINDYRGQRERICRLFRESPLSQISQIYQDDAGTHFLLHVRTDLSDVEIKWAARQQGILVNCLSEYCFADAQKYRGILVIHYSDMEDEVLQKVIRALEEIFL